MADEEQTKLGVTGMRALGAETIKAEIERAESELANHRAKVQAANVSVALLSDEAHLKIENEIAADRRAFRLSYRI
jgi:hypothetical protein